jgi:hypothetical protein
MRKLVAFVAGPYRAKTDFETLANIRAAERAAVALWRFGFAVICPHLNSAFMSGACDEEHFIDGYRELCDRSDVVLMLPRADESEGALAEVVRAIRKGTPVVPWTDDAEGEMSGETAALLRRARDSVAAARKVAREMAEAADDEATQKGA